MPNKSCNILDHRYTPCKDSHRAVSLPAFGTADHDAIFLLPKYMHRVKQSQPATREVRRWSASSEAKLQEALQVMDWDMFKGSTGDVNELMDMVMCYIAKLTDNVTPMVTVKNYPNQKPWVEKSIREALKACAAAFKTGRNTGEMTPYEAESYKLVQLRDRDSRRLWQGLKLS